MILSIGVEICIKIIITCKTWFTLSSIDTLKSKCYAAHNEMANLLTILKFKIKELMFEGQIFIVYRQCLSFSETSVTGK